MKPPTQVANDATRARAAWLEDVIAGLLINGVTKDEIEIQEHPGPMTVVAVRGAPRYSWKFSVVQK